MNPIRFLLLMLARPVKGAIGTLLLGLMMWCSTMGMAQAAPSYCTAIWGIIINGSNYNLQTYNTTSNVWNTPVIATLTASNDNGLSGASNNGQLYYVNRTNTQVFVVNPLVNPATNTLIGTLPLPTPPTGNSFFIVGASADPAGNLFIYGTDGGTSPNVWAAVAQVSTVNAATLTSWTQLRTSAGATPTVASSGDIFFDNVGQSWVVSNTTPSPTFVQINLNTSPLATFAQVSTPPTSITVVGASTAPVTPVGGSVNPVDGLIYINTNTASNVTLQLNLATAIATMKDTTNTYTASDMGNCTLPVPDKPTVSKSFTPTSATTAFSTTTLTINIGNSNLAPIWLNTDFKDVLPTNMVVTSTTGLTSSGCGSTTGITTGNNVTATIGSNSITFAAPGLIPVGGCTISVVVRGSTTGGYLNTIAAGSLTTTTGANAVAASAAYLVSTRDFSISKSQSIGSSANFTKSGISIAAGGTVQYQLTVTNSGSSQNSGTVTFTDTLPVLITPVLTVVATTTTGGACVTATAVLAGATQVTGTYTNAPPSGQCIVTITARGSTTLVQTTVNNTVTMTGTALFPDSIPSNNSDTVATTIVPGVNISIAKTNNVSSLTAGQTTSYTITVVATAPAATVTNALVSDPAATGLNCTSVSIVASGSAVTPTLAQTSMVNLQGSGIPISFNSGAAGTASFVVTCGVTATGQ